MIRICIVFQLVLFFSENSHFELLERPCRKQQMISLNRLVSKIIFAYWATICVYNYAKTSYYFALLSTVKNMKQNDFLEKINLYNF